VKKPPSDLDLLKAIWKRHREEYEQGRVGRASDVMVPIDVPRLAADLGISVHSVAGRLHHHLDKKHGSGHTHLFSMQVGPDVNAVNFPLLEALLAELWEQQDRDHRTFKTAVASIAISVVALIISIITSREWEIDWLSWLG
jgi:hypothetical protein